MQKSKPKGKNYILDVVFEDGNSRALLSPFIEIISDDSVEEVKESSMEKLEKLIKKRNIGEISYEEFKQMKKEILGK